MQFKISGKDPINKVLWPEESVYKATGGFSLDKTNLKEGSDFLEKGALMAVNFTTRVAKLVKTAVVNAIATSSATAIQVKKSHHLKIGDIVGRTVGGTAYAITAIGTTNAAYDTITVATTLGVALAVGDVLFQSSEAGATAAVESNVANSILIHDSHLEESTTLNVGLSIFEIQEANLPYGVTAANKASLTSRFLFV